MKKLFNLFFGLSFSVLFLSGCYETQSVLKTNLATTTPQPTTNSSNKETKPAAIEETETEEARNADCTRATPRPIVKKSVFPNTSFVLSKDKRTGTETVFFSNGDRLIITNAGCEYYYLNFRFETERFSAEPSDYNYWYQQAAKFIEEVGKGIDEPLIQSEKAVTVLKNYPLKSKNPQFGEEIDYGGNDLRTFVTINKVEKIDDKKFALEVAFAVGPL